MVKFDYDIYIISKLNYQNYILTLYFDGYLIIIDDEQDNYYFISY